MSNKPVHFLLALLATVAALATAAVKADETGAVPGMNRFAVASYQELARGKGNLIFSPFNIASSLSMALAGARGETAAEMAKILNQASPEAGYNMALAGLLRDLKKEGNVNGNHLLTANNIWVQQDLHVKAEFRQIMENLFRAPFRPVDFRKGGEQARLQINGWTQEQTRSKITDLVGPDSITEDTRMVLTSAIYFLGQWESKFRSKNTRPSTFNLDGGGTVQTLFMHQTAKFGYREAAAVQILEMGYSGTPLAFDILLPMQKDGLSDLERSFTPANLSAWLQPFDAETIEIYIPRFRAESDFSLREPLSHMGMANAFTASADFSGIDDRRDLQLSSVVHKAFVDVSEAGTEAAAATATLTKSKSRPPRVFRADHPFLFLIRDTRSGLILFEGRLYLPRQSESGQGRR
jgi:serpin B